MATRSCPECGAQYVATVRRCIDCDVVLVDDVVAEAEGESTASTAAPVGAGEQVGYELDGWGNQLKVTLDGMLARAGIGRVWEAGALVVAAEDEDAVDDLIATLEGDDLPDLPDDTPRVALEIEGLDADGHAELDARLLASGVPHAWDDEGALIVAESDEDEVLALIEDVLDGPEDDTDGLAAQNALSALYLAVDRLQKNPHDRKLATAYVRAADGVDDLPVPYGFGGDDWADLVAETERLAAALVPHADVVVEASADPADADDRDPEGEAAEPDEGDGVVDEAAADDGGDGDEPDADRAPADADRADDGEEDDPGEDAEDAEDAEDGDDRSTDEDDAEDDDDAQDEDDDDHGLRSVEAARDAARALRARLVDLV